MSCPKIGVWSYRRSDTDELKYSVRSAIKNLGLEKIVIIGDKPSWFQESEKAIYLPFEPPRNEGWTRAFVPWQYLSRLIKADIVHEEFLYFNDDFFVLQPIKDWVNYERDLDDYNSKVKQHNHVYHLRDMRAIRLLKQQDEHHYNLHIPISLSPDNLKDILSFWYKSGVKDIGFRTYYGNKFFTNLPTMSDVKHRASDLFFSSSDKFWEYYGQQYRDMFPDKSYAERHN